MNRFDAERLAAVLSSAKNGKPLALVTGAAGSIGVAVTRKLCSEGYAVIAADLVLDRLEAALEAALEDHDSVAGLELDVASSADWERASKVVSDGVGRLDVLVNNAGTLQAPVTLEEVSEEEFRRVIDVNLIGTFLGIKAFTALLRNAGQASIVNFSSSEAFLNTPLCGAYSASKWGLRGLTKTVAIELASSGIRCNSVHPWAIESPMARGEEGSSTLAGVIARVPMNRTGRADEAAELVSFLAGSKSSFSTGSEFMIDGGHTAWSGY